MQIGLFHFGIFTNLASCMFAATQHDDLEYLHDRLNNATVAVLYFDIKGHFWVTSAAFITCSATVILMPLRHFTWVWFGLFQCIR